MLRSCSFPGCGTPTLGAYYWEHERLLRSEADAERDEVRMRVHPLARELAAMWAATAQPDQRSADARMSSQ